MGRAKPYEAPKAPVQEPPKGEPEKDPVKEMKKEVQVASPKTRAEKGVEAMQEILGASVSFSARPIRAKCNGERFCGRYSQLRGSGCCDPPVAAGTGTSRP